MQFLLESRMIPSATCRPIFVVGTGRSGSTVFFDVLARHPQVAWLSTLSRRYPSRPWLSRYLMHARSIHLIDSLLGARIGPSEAYPFWERLCPGFSNPFRDLTGDDVTAAGAENIGRAVKSIINRKRSRFLAKITGWPRIGFLDQVFPDALFVEVRRDARATANSLLHVAFWDGWRGPANWRRGPLPSDLEDIWLAENQSFVALAALECVIVQRAVDASFAHIDPARHCTITYSHLCSNPVETYRRVTEFCGLRWTNGFESTVGRFRFQPRDDQWRLTLTQDQQRILERTLSKANGTETS